MESHTWDHGETLNHKGGVLYRTFWIFPYQIQQLKPYILICFACLVWIAGPDYNHLNNGGGQWAKQTSSFFGLCSQKCHWAANIKLNHLVI